MKRKLYLLFFLASLTTLASAQKYATRTGFVRFFSKTPMENIEATTHQASCIADIATGEVVAKILISSFQFEKALMQEHFNENYMESDKFPQASLKAKVTNTIDYASIKPQEVVLQGDLTLHGVTLPVTIKGNLQRKDQKLEATSTFMVKPADFNIKIPKAVVNNIAKEIEVSLKFELEPLTK
jgi:polyisoprenoid-binding protein YceI